MEKYKNTQMKKNMGILLLAVWITSAILILGVAAETSGTGTTGNAGFSWSWSTDNTNTNAEGTFDAVLNGTTLECNISAKSSTYIPEEKNDCDEVIQDKVDAKNTTITAIVTNNTGSTIKIDKIETEKAIVSELVAGKSLENGKSFTIKLTANYIETTDTISNQETDTVTITYTVVENVEVIFYGASSITYIYGEETISGEEDFAVTTQAPGTTITLPDVIIDAGTFLGWRINDGSIQQSGTTITVNADTTIYPVVLSGNEIFPFTVNGIAYCFWEDAVYAAGTNGTIVLNQNYTLPTSLVANGVSPQGGKFVTGTDGTLSYTIPPGVTLLIPFDDTNTLITKNMGDYLLDAYNATVIARSEHRAMKMTAGSKIIVNGSINVGSKTANQFIGQVGPYGAIYMDEDSNITVQDGGTFYAWGYIFHGEEGSGTVTVQSGGTVYESMSIMDYPGSASLVRTLRSNNVFPMRSYAIRNVEVPMTLQSGAKEYAFTCLYGDRVGTHPIYRLLIANGTVDNESPVFLNRGEITKSFKDSRQGLIINGDLTINPLVVVLPNTIAGTVSFSSAESTGFYIPSCYDMALINGTITLNDNVIMCEGSTLAIDRGATANTNGKNIYILDADQDPGAVVSSNGCGINVQDVHRNYYTNVPNDAVLNINGTVLAGSGFYTSSSGACITSSEGGGEIQISSAPADTSVNVKNTNSYTSVNITSARLLNADTTYTSTQNVTSLHTFVYSNGKWVCKEHATVADAAIAATCTTAGKTEGSHCSVCNTVIVAQEVIPATGHKTVKDTAVAATCTASGLTEGSHCGTCSAILVAQTVIPATGHTEVTDAAVAATCTESGLTQGSHCSVCTATIVAQEVVPAAGHSMQTNIIEATCTEDGKETKTCTVCGHTEEKVLSATGHSWKDGVCEVCGESSKNNCNHEYVSSMIKPTCTEDGYTIHTCSICGDTYKTDIVDASHTWVDATCVDPEYCVVCGITGAQAIGHNYTTEVTSATCTEVGYTTHTCTACGDTYTDNHVAALGHTNAQGVKENIEEPTCSKEGSYDWVIYCSVCGAEVSREKLSISFVESEGSTDGHSFGEWVTEKEPTCTTTGTRCRVCTGCGKTLRQIIETTAHTETKLEASAPTCTTPGYTEGRHCATCGTVFTAQEVIAATGHDWSDWEITTAPTSKKTGVETRTCGICQEFETRTIISIYGTSVRVGDSLDLYFYVRRDMLEGTAYYAQITRSYADNVSTEDIVDPYSETLNPIPFANWEPYGDYYRLCYSGIAGKEMTDEVSVTLYHDDGIRASIPATETISRYALRTLKSSSATEELKAVLMDMVNFGANCQTYFKYNTGNLANADENFNAYETYGGKTLQTWSTVHNGGDVSFEASVSAENRLVYTFYLQDVTSETVVVSYINHYNQQVEKAVIPVLIDGKYRVDVPQLAVADGHRQITCTFTDSTGAQTVTGSIEGYLTSIDGTGKDNIVFEKLMYFVDSAYAYFH